MAVAIYLPASAKSNMVQKSPPHVTPEVEIRVVESLASETPHIILASRLLEDQASPWYGRVLRKRTATSGLQRRVSLPLFETTIRRFLRDTEGTSPVNADSRYQLLLFFWQAVRAVFPEDWKDERHSLLCKGLGLQTLTLLLTDFVKETPPEQLTESYFRIRIGKLRGNVDWGNHGAFSKLNGAEGVTEVHTILRSLTANLRVLLVDTFPGRRKPKTSNGDDSRWHPPVGLLKIGRLHLDRGDVVRFVSGRNRETTAQKWDRVYIAAPFTWHFNDVVRSVQRYTHTLRDNGRVFVGGGGATLLAADIEKATGVLPIEGRITSARQLDIDDDTNVDGLVPAYELVDPVLYAVSETIYAHTTRGCVNRCRWCAVPRIEPEFVPYINIIPTIREHRTRLGDPSRLLLMDNNVLASPGLESIVEDLLELGYGRGEMTKTNPPRQRVVDFNQGVDADFINEKTIGLLARLNVQPLRIAFDRLKEKKKYVHAVRLASENGFHDISNYLLFNFRDTPRDLYERIRINIELNKEFEGNGDGTFIYSFPMRFAPVKGVANRRRDRVIDEPVESQDWLHDPAWTPIFLANIENMKGAAGGAIPKSASFAYRVVGCTFEEFIANLYSPRTLLRNRNRHERHVYEYEPKRKPGDGKLEEFREFVFRLLERQDGQFRFFHEAVAPNSVQAIREAIENCTDSATSLWLPFYLK